MRLPAAEPRSTAGLLVPSQYLSGTIWLTPYSMVSDWRVSRAGPMPFCWPSCSLLVCLQLFSLSILFFYRLVVWGWGLRTDRVSISLSRPCITSLFLVIIKIIEEPTRKNNILDVFLSNNDQLTRRIIITETSMSDRNIIQIETNIKIVEAKTTKLRKAT